MAARRNAAARIVSIALLLAAFADGGVRAAEPTDPPPPVPPAPAVEPAPSEPGVEPPAAGEPPQQPSTWPAGDPEGVLETTRSTLRSTTEWLARGVDRWFGDKPFEEGGKVTRGRFGIDLLWREREGVDANVRFDARVRLPNVERVSYLFIGRDDDREVVTDKPGELSNRERLLEQVREDQSFFAGIALPLKQLFEFRIGLRAREKIFGQIRFRRVWPLGPNGEVEFRETLFWTLREHFGSTTSLSFEHDFSPSFAFRWINSTTVSQRSDRFEWSSTPGLYKAFGDGAHILSLQAPLSGQQHTDVPINEYGVQVKWQQPNHHDWVIGELLTGHYWPRPDEFTPRGTRWAVGAGVKLLF